MRYLLPLLLLGTTACYAPRAYGPGPGDYPDYPDASPYGARSYDQPPLQATIWYDEYTGFASFNVNRPAHVAIFAISEFGSARMLYPAIGYGGQQRFSYGRHTVRTEASAYRFASNRSLVYGSAPTYIVLVAAERPLDVAQFMATGRSPWIDHQILTRSPYGAAEMLAREIVPQPGMTEYTLAYHVVWPTNWLYGSNRAQPSYVWVNCNGVFMSVPAYAYYQGWFVCPRNDRTVPPADSARRLPELKKKLPKRPPVPTGWIATDDGENGHPAKVIPGIPGRGDGKAGTVKKALPPGPRTGERVTTERPVLRTLIPDRPEVGRRADAEGRTAQPSEASNPRQARERPALPELLPSRGEKASPTATAAPPRVDRPAEPAREPRAVAPRVERRSPPRPQPRATPRAERHASPPRVQHSSPPSRPAASPAPRPSSSSSTSSKPSKPTKPGGGGGGNQH